LDRRAVLGTLASGLLAAPLAVEAQAADRIPLVGILDNGVPRLFIAFREGLHELGYVEGQNIQLVVKSALGRPDLLPGPAAELVALKPEVVVTTGVAVRAVRRASPTIPIVVAATRDAVTAGFTSSLAKPADNIAGQSFLCLQAMRRPRWRLRQRTGMADVFVRRPDRSSGEGAGSRDPAPGGSSLRSSHTGQAQGPSPSALLASPDRPLSWRGRERQAAAIHTAAPGADDHARRRGNGRQRLGGADAQSSAPA
jgi:hypothetical protein